MEIGLFFGTFNPIHNGHLLIAKSVINQLKLDQIWFVLSPLSPFKNNDELLDKNSSLQGSGRKFFDRNRSLRGSGRELLDENTDSDSFGSSGSHLGALGLEMARRASFWQ